MTDDIAYRRAIEALRSGVPNRDAVRVLGASQPEIEASIRQQLVGLSESSVGPPPPAGVVVAGDFGTGKSHLLEHVRHIALDEGFVCSRLAVSKEMPIYDLPKVLRAAVAELTIPDKRDRGLTPIVDLLKFNTPAYAEFYRWVNDATDESLDARFAATLHLFEYDRSDEEFRDRIVSFWAGDRLSVAELKKKLREHGQVSTYRIGRAPNERELALQRTLFAAQLIRAAGYKGWILLIDEVELISSYSRLQRARSNAELALWGNRLIGQPIPGVLSIMAITSDVVSYLFDLKRDRDEVPNQLRARGDEVLAAAAERGMRLIERERVTLQPPDDAVLRVTYERAKEIYTRGYDWSAPDALWPERLSSTPMREYIRSWINQWDLQRAYPGYVGQTEITDVQPDYTENPDIESASEDAQDFPEAR